MRQVGVNGQGETQNATSLLQWGQQRSRALAFQGQTFDQLSSGTHDIGNLR